MRSIATFFGLAALLLAGCQSAIQTPIPDLKTPLPGTYDPSMLTPAPEETDAPGGSGVYPPGALAAQAYLAEALALPVDAVGIIRIENNLWPDSCLGLGGPEEICAQQIVPGYYIVMQANSLFYEFHINEDGSQLRPLQPADAFPPAASAARQVLAGQLGLLNPAQVLIAEVQPVDWPDACLGVEQPGQACAEVVTPGYRVILVAQGVRYTYHTDALGGQVVAAGGQTVQFGQSYILLFSSTDPETCQMIQIGSSGAAFGPCGGDLQGRSFPGPQRPMELADMVADFAFFQMETPFGLVTFQGRGSQPATPEQARAVAAWAQLAAGELRDQPLEPQAGLLLTWLRTGGFAGVCDRLDVYESGWAYAVDCKGEEKPFGQVRLSAQNLQILYNWVDQFSAGEAVSREAVADGFQYDLGFKGRGQQSLTEAQQQAMFAFAGDLYGAILP